jgi:hypothetical protein
MTGQIKFVGSLVMFTVFAVSLILFAVNFANENDTYTNLDSDFEESLANSQSNLSTWKTVVVNDSKSYYSSEITEGETVTTGGMFKASPKNALGTATTFIALSFSSVFGSSSEFGWVLTTIGAFLAFALFLYSWKTWKGGNP